MESLIHENKQLHQLISLLDDHEVITFENGRFTNELREVIMELLSMNVSMCKVLKKLAGINVHHLPSAGSQSRFLEEALILAKMQVVEEMNASESKCLHGDGTSKYHRHYQNFQITTASGRTLSFGLSEIYGGDAASTLQSFTESIDDLCMAIDSKDNETDFAKLISSIKTTMSDLGPVNPVFNCKLKLLREQLLPKVVENWDMLAKDEKSEMSDMANYYCKLHLLANFASETDKVLKSFEELLLTDEIEQIFSFKTRESSAARLVRTSCKAFHVRRSDEAGVASYFDSFLNGRGEKSLLVPFIGNRFNILFYNAGAVYYHADAIKEFFKAWPDPNKLLKAVNEDISNNLFWLEHLVLLINNTKENTENILSLNPYLFRLKMKLSEFCNDASSLLLGSTIFNERDIQHNQDVLWESLFKEKTEEFDVLTQQALEVILHAASIILERQCVDQLPGGKYWHASNSIKICSESVPTTNKASESDFAILDLLIRTKPNISIHGIQAPTMWARNETTEWLNKLTSDQKLVLFDTACANVLKIKEKFKERKIKLILEKKEKLLIKHQLKSVQKFIFPKENCCIK